MKLKKDAALEQQQEQARIKRLNERMTRAVRAALHLGKDEGKARIEAQAGLFFDEEHGALMAAEMERAASHEDYKALRKKMAVAEAQDNDVPFYVAGKDVSEHEGGGLIGLSRFLPIDKVKVWLFGSLSFGALVLSLVNANVALRSSYIPAIEAAPWKGWMVAGIAPGIACSLKLLVSIFSRPKFNDIARKTLYVSTAVLGMLWIYLFSEQFQISGGDDWTTPVSSVLGMSFTHLQLLVEICCGAAMMSATQSILDRYQNLPPIPNLAKGLSSEYARQLRASCDKALKEFEQKDNDFQQRGAKRQSFINEQVDSFLIALARHNDLHGQSGE